MRSPGPEAAARRTYRIVTEAFFVAVVLIFAGPYIPPRELGNALVLLGLLLFGGVCLVIGLDVAGTSRYLTRKQRQWSPAWLRWHRSERFDYRLNRVIGLFFAVMVALWLVSVVVR